MFPDYHMHTNFSDGRDSHEDMLESAEFKNMLEIGFTDHICLYPIGWAMDLAKIPQMVSNIEKLQRKSQMVKVRLGIEMDYFPDKEKNIKALLKTIPLDYCIGSVHFIDDWNFDSDIRPYDAIDLDWFYRKYFELVQKSVKTGLFDIIGHCDLAKKFGYKPSIKLDKIYKETAKIMSDYGVVVEYNTSGKNKPCAEFYPSVDFLEYLYHYKVPVTLGSDAHVEQNIGEYFDEAVNVLKLIGFSKLTLFSGRKRDYLTI
ncbi:MAG TPA: histidinol-phosphatase HisJ family protein [Tenuifilaceae bacterium]|nr:histidinol-phosphatase HisJ family protein [Tenuifilaceae bacterium]